MFIGVLERVLVKLSLSFAVDFYQFEVLLAFLEIVYDIESLLVLVGLLEVLKQFEDDRVAHLHPSFLCLAEKIVVFILQFLILESFAMQFYFFLVAQVRNRLFRQLLLYFNWLCQRLLLDLVITLTFLIDLSESSIPYRGHQTTRSR